MSKPGKFLLMLGTLLLLVLPAFAQDATVSLIDSDFGPIMVGPNGMTLYSFDRDPIGETVCYNQCAENWPPLIVESADAVTAGEGIPGVLSTVEREDGSLQVAYNGVPLYYWVRDENPGDTTGNRVGGVWWVVPPATVSVLNTATLGNVLVGPNGMTLYLFTNDTQAMGEEGAVSNCYDQCAENWPPLTVEALEDIIPGMNMPGTFSTTERTDGTLQVTYNGWPLYFWARDAAIGDTTGEGVGDVWYAVPRESVSVQTSEELGDYIADHTGMTLYTFANDEAGVSNCTGDCAEAWPPFTAAEGARLTGAVGMEGELGTIEREEGVFQVTYNGMPLYYWQDDAAPGDTTGQGLGDVWFVAAP